MSRIRLNRFLATHADLSKRKADEAITEGRVRLNNKKAQLGDTIHPDFDTVHLDGKEIRRQRLEYVVFHKPKGLITTKSDPQDRKTIYSVLPESMHHLKPAGRLDRNTAGLLILSNDGAFLNALIHPKKALKKIYRVKLDKPIDEKSLAKLEKGLLLDPENVTAYLKVEAWREPEIIVVSTITGYNRQIRRMFAMLGFDVVDLKRQAIGPIELKQLAVGKTRFMTYTERGQISAFTQDKLAKQKPGKDKTIKGKKTLL